jgi:hypothetical protein
MLLKKCAHKCVLNARCNDIRFVIANERSKLSVRVRQVLNAPRCQQKRSIFTPR